jgi:hypothetical protein
LAATNGRTLLILRDPSEAENVEKPRELHRQYRAREVGALAEEDKGRV